MLCGLRDEFQVLSACGEVGCFILAGGVVEHALDFSDEIIDEHFVFGHGTVYSLVT